MLFRSPSGRASLIALLRSAIGVAGAAGRFPALGVVRFFLLMCVPLEENQGAPEGGEVRRGGANDANIGNDMVPTVIVSGPTQQLASNTQYICQFTSQSNLALPSDSQSIIGDTIEVVGTHVAGWLISQAASQQIFMANSQSSIGVSGSLASNRARDTVKIMKIGSNTWQVISGVGNLTLT